MVKISIETSFEKKSNDELTQVQKDIVKEACKACENSYSPYSKFSVGAALEMEDGKILSANNQENAAYPSGLCAERTVLFYAKAKFPYKEIVRMAIVAKHDGLLTQIPISPCGACRQVMIETAKRQKCKIELILVGIDNCIIIKDVNDLLPLQFNDENMR